VEVKAGVPLCQDDAASANLDVVHSIFTGWERVPSRDSALDDAGLSGGGVRSPDGG